MAEKKIYIAIDLKSFYASVECVERGLDPLTTHLVVADESRSSKTICLAVSPSLKDYDISGRARLFEVIQKVKDANDQRFLENRKRRFQGESYDAEKLKKDPSLALSYIVATPRMAKYIEYSAKIYEVYLKYVSPESIHIYSIDEVFIDITNYLTVHKMTPRELTKTMILDVLETTGITATGGIGTNLYLCKVAMDIVSKHVKADKEGVRIAQLDEERYRHYLWSHKPITDFWRVGRGYAKRLEKLGLYTMGDIAKCSVGTESDHYNENLLYRTFGVNAELLIDHAWGYESCTMEDIKAYKPENHSIGTGQVLHSPYHFEKAKLVVKEMVDQLALELVDKALVTNQIVLTVGYDIENVSSQHAYHHGEIVTDLYGRKIPKQAHGTANVASHTSSTKVLTEAVMTVYDRIVDKNLTIKRLNMSANHVILESECDDQPKSEQLDIFTDYDTLDEQRVKQAIALEKEKRLQKATLQIKKKYGKNALLKGMNFEEGANARERNKSIGGHKE